LSYPAILEYLNALASYYFNASKKEKTKLLDHACKVTGLNRKSLIRKLNSKAFDSKRKGSCGAKPTYDHELLAPHIEYLWNEMGRISGKRMKEALPIWMPYYQQNEVTNQVKYQLLKMSAATLERFLQKIRRDLRPSEKGLCSTTPASYMQNQIPINTLDHRVTTPGFIQTDTVAHCGTSLMGNFANSITTTDILTTWTENKAVYNKRSTEMAKGLEELFRRFPFKILSLNSDSGSEFLNKKIHELTLKKGIIFTRSRPYKKNDNCYVEQKNDTHVRGIFGYERIEHEELIKLMNEIYQDYWNPLHNFFIPNFKLKEKVRIGGRIKKTYDAPLTPYQRVQLCDVISTEIKMDLSSRRKEYNPFELRRELELKLSTFRNKLKEYNEKRETYEKDHKYLQII